MPSLDHLYHPHMLFRQEQTNKGTRLKGLFLTWLPTLPSHPHVPSTHITPDRSLSPCQLDLALVPRKSSSLPWHHGETTRMQNNWPLHWQMCPEHVQNSCRLLCTRESREEAV